VVFLDSQSSIHLTKNNAYHSKTKHISFKYHYVRDTVTAGEITARKIHTSENPEFEHCLELVSVHSI